MNRILAATLTLSLIVGCGSGGSGAPPGNQNPPPGPIPPPPQITLAQVLQILSDCAPEDLGQLVEVLAAFQPFLDPTAPPPPFQIGAPAGNQIPFELDLDANMQPDLVGSFAFFSALGAEITPFTPADLAGGFPALLALLPTLPAGTEIRASFNLVRPTPYIATISFFMGAGAVATVDGRFESQGPTCALTISFQDVPPGDLDGAFPDTVVDFVLAAQAGQGVGTITFDGSNTARVQITFGGVGPFAFLINLDTGALTIAP